MVRERFGNGSGTVRERVGYLNGFFTGFERVAKRRHLGVIYTQFGCIRRLFYTFWSGGIWVQGIKGP